MMKHTEDLYRNELELLDEEGQAVALTACPVAYYVDGLPDIKSAEEWLDRIVACVNACKGISNEALEGGVIGEMVKICKEFGYMRATNRLKSRVRISALGARVEKLLAKLEASDNG